MGAISFSFFLILNNNTCDSNDNNKAMRAERMVGIGWIANSPLLLTDSRILQLLVWLSPMCELLVCEAGGDHTSSLPQLDRFPLWPARYWTHRLIFCNCPYPGTTAPLILPASCEALRKTGIGAAHIPPGAAVAQLGLELFVGKSRWLFSLFGSAGAGSLPWQPTSETCQHQMGPAGPRCPSDMKEGGGG